MSPISLISESKARRRAYKESINGKNVRNVMGFVDVPKLAVEERIAAGFDWDRQGMEWEWVTATEALMRVGVKDPTRNEARSAGFALRKLNGNQGRKSNGRHLVAIPATFVENTG